MRFDLYYNIKVIFFNSIFDLFTKAICIIFIFLEQIIECLAIIKSQAFKQIFFMKKFWLLFQYQDIQKLKYYINLILNIIVKFIIINAFLVKIV